MRLDASNISPEFVKKRMISSCDAEDSLAANLLLFKS